MLRDEGGAMPVFEAVLVAILIFTTIAFYVSVQRPAPPPERGGLDLGRIAADTLVILDRRTFPDPVDESPMAIETWVTRIMDNDTAVADDMDAFIDEATTPGTLYALRLHNGVDSLHLLPNGSTFTPHGARASEILFFPNWTAQERIPPAPPWVVVGQKVDSVADEHQYNMTDPAVVECIEGPNGSSTNSTGTDWNTTWHARLGRIPDDIPGGTYTGYQSDCSTPTPSGEDAAQVMEEVVAGESVPLATRPIGYGFTVTSSDDCIKAQDGSESNATGTAWTSLWNDTAGAVPGTVPGGLWTAYTDSGCSTGATYLYLTDDPVHPGEPLPDTTGRATAHMFVDGTVKCIESPTGSKVGPGGDEWIDLWQDQDSTTLRVPSEAPFGLWAGYTDPDCATGTPWHLRVGLPDGTATDHPAYGLQLVVWFGA